jgi:hypothetical protein
MQAGHALRDRGKPPLIGTKSNEHRSVIGYGSVWHIPPEHPPVLILICARNV